MRKAITALILLIVAGTSAQAKRQLTRQENDSIVKALVTIWGNQLQFNTPEKSGNAEYLRGLSEGLNASQDNKSHYQGLQDAIVLNNRLTQVEQMGGFTIDRSKLATMFERTAKGRGSKFTPQTAERYMNYIITAISAEEAVETDSKAWLDSIRDRKGVHSEMSGLLRETVKEGTGNFPPLSGCDVVVTYVGKLYNGKVFDKTHETQPVRFDLDTLIPGFAEGIYTMRQGGRSILYLPAEIAYGEGGVTGVIPPNAALMFDVTLHEIIPH